MPWIIFLSTKFLLSWTNAKLNTCLKKEIRKNCFYNRDLFSGLLCRNSFQKPDSEWEFPLDFSYLELNKSIPWLRWGSINTLTTVKDFSFVWTRNPLLGLPSSHHKPEYKALMELHHVALQSKFLHLHEVTTQTWSRVDCGSSQWEKLFSFYE